MSRQWVPDSSTVYTPAALAAAMVHVAGEDQSSTLWLDPCVGDGAFVTAMSESGVPKKRIIALDLARRGSVSDVHARTTRGIDFIAWASRRRALCDRVVMNPPYVALSRLRGKPRVAALEVAYPNGVRLPLKANYWCAFVLAALRVIRPGGAMVAVLPAAWEYARYATRLRETVASAFSDLVIVRSSAPLFAGVLDGAVVIVARERGAAPRTIRRVEVADAAACVRTLNDMGGGKRPLAGSVVHSIGRKRKKDVPLSELLDVRIGGVTGDAHYFLLTEDERKELGLPRASLRPVVSRCRHLQGAFLTASSWQRLLDGGERVWLFSPSGTAVKHDAVKRYLREGKRGACQLDGYKVRARNPWYQTPLPTRVDGFLSGMSKRLPFLVIRKMPRLTATNTLYVVRFKRSVDAESRVAVGVALLSSRVRKDLASRARQYADGLLKFEPTELGSVHVTLPMETAGARSALRAATDLLLGGREKDAETVADRWIDGDGVLEAPVAVVAEPTAPLVATARLLLARRSAGSR